MAITYEWKIPRVDTHPTHTDEQDPANTEADVICNIHWKLIATDDVNNIKVSNNGIVSVNLDDLSGFISFEDVTKVQAITWIEAWHNKYPDKNIATMKARLDRKIAEKITPVIEKH